MSLILEGVALAIDGAALVIDCACCFLELCDRRACVTETDCDDAALQPGTDCFCRGGFCTSDPSCVDDDDCPDGLVCINGQCLPPCRGQQCDDDADCPIGCICVDDGCFDANQLYYCWKQVKDENGNDIPIADQESECRKGVPIPPMYEQAGGPYLSYSACAATACDAKFSCNPVIGDCFPDPAGIFEDLPLCQANCGDGPPGEGRCCESEVCYDADGNVISVIQRQAPCCPSSCTRDTCISDPAQEPPYCRTFRQFNRLYDNCDQCPTVDDGPCCHTDDNGKQVCSIVNKAECENILNGDWKGNNWFDCETPRVPDIGAEFACPNCNGNGDCSCEDGEFCYANRCNSCRNPNSNPTKTGTVAEVRFDDYADIDQDPQLYRKYYFRVLTCPGQNNDDFPFEPVNIYGRKLETPDVLDLLITVTNSPNDVDSRGYTTYQDEECYTEIVAKKQDGIPARIGLCYFWQDPPILNGICQYNQYTCECSSGDPDFECPNCHPEADVYETYTWAEITPQQNPPVEGVCFDVNGCARRWFDASTKKWFRETWEYGWNGALDINTYRRTRDRLIVLMPDGSLQDKTDEWVTGKQQGIYTDCLIKSEYEYCDIADENGDCIDGGSCIGSDCLTEDARGIPPPASPPDPLGNCTINLTNPNPLP